MKKIFLSFVLLTLCACASFLGTVLQQPKVELNGIRLRDADLQGATLVFLVQVENPNNVAINVDKIHYKVFLNNKEISEAVSEKPTAIPAKSQGLIEVPLPLEYRKVFSNLQELLVAESVSYKIEGDAKLNLFSIPFSKEGTLELPGPGH